MSDKYRTLHIPAGRVEEFTERYGRTEIVTFDDGSEVVETIIDFAKETIIGEDGSLFVIIPKIVVIDWDE